MCELCPEHKSLIDKLNEENEHLNKTIEEFRSKIEELERRLKAYENAHSPAGRTYLRRIIENPKKPGQKQGHEGITRNMPKPDKTIRVMRRKCPYCKHKLGKPVIIESRLIEDIPKPRPAKAIQYLLYHYFCGNCKREITAKHKNCPDNGRFGFNMLAQATLMKYAERLPVRRIMSVLENRYGIHVSPASILDFTRRTAEFFRRDYTEILQKIRNAGRLCIDETSIRIGGRRCWIWIFVSKEETFAVVANSRGEGVLEYALGSEFNGIITCDGWKVYVKYADKHGIILQRCWAHILREAEFLSKRECTKESVRLYRALKRLYERIKDGSGLGLKRKAVAVLRRWMHKRYRHKETRRFVNKLRNASDFLFTFLEHPDVEPTNNAAERELREHVIHRKIIGTLRNEKGAYIHETMMTVIQTWNKQGLNPYEVMAERFMS